jgi:hypothetical protein
MSCYINKCGLFYRILWIGEKMSNLAKKLNVRELSEGIADDKNRFSHLGKVGKQKIKENRKERDKKYNSMKKLIKDTGVNAMAAKSFGTNYPEGAYDAEPVSVYENIEKGQDKRIRKKAGRTSYRPPGMGPIKDFTSPIIERKYGGGIQKMRHGGKHRGCGVAQKGVRPTKMV